MTVLQALDGYYGRMAARGDAEQPGYGREKISFSVRLAPDGGVVDVIDLRVMAGKKPGPRLMAVPKVGAAPKRTVAIAANALWDKTAYVLGRTGGDGRRTAQEHAAFKDAHAKLLDGQTDEGLAALRRFLERWKPEAFDAKPFSSEMLDTNVIFQLDDETIRVDGRAAYLHERPAARALIDAQAGSSGPARMCLVSGVAAAPARLHPTIKGVEGAQTSGAALVSFNLDAFASHGQAQGDNAPTSEAAAFRYGEALNRMLDRGSRNRVARPIGDATVVFWADTSDTVDEDAAAAADADFGNWFDPPARAGDDQDAAETARLHDALQCVAEGRPEQANPKLKSGTRFHVLGLAPNAARLSVRYWLSDNFAAFAARLLAHFDDIAIEPTPWRGRPPSIQRLLVKTTALQEKFDNIPPLLAGEFARAVLGGGRYPRTLLTAALIRLRAGDDPGTGWHASAIRAVLARDFRLNLISECPPMSLNRVNPDPAYQLGRLFAALEAAQRQALGVKVNATIRDRYLGAASATPAGVFPLLLRGAQNHLGKLRKDGRGGWIEREIEEIADHLGDSYPRTLRLEAQGRFFIGYYHQRRAQSAARPALAEPNDTEQESDDAE